MPWLQVGSDFLGCVLDGVFYGLHAATFLVFIMVHKHQGKVFYQGVLNVAVIALFVLCTTIMTIDIIGTFIEITDTAEAAQLTAIKLSSAYSALYSLVDFICQMALIYRCWLLWERSLLVVLPPLLMALSVLGTEMTLLALPWVEDKGPLPINTLLTLGRYSFSTSLAVNVIVMTLIVLRIWTLSRRLSFATPMVQRPYNTIMAMLLESGVTIMVAQLIYLVLFSTESPVFNVFAGIITQIYGFTPAIVMIRVVMGVSYESASETKAGSSIVFERKEPASSSTRVIVERSTFTAGSALNNMEKYDI